MIHLAEPFGDHSVDHLAEIARVDHHGVIGSSGKGPAGTAGSVSKGGTGSKPT
jgi:hypothetical protein